MANGDQLAQLPTQINPQALATLFPGAQAPAAPATPPMVPPTGGGQPDITQEMIEASRAGRQTFGEEVAKSRGLGSQIEELVRQQQATPVPKFGPQIEHGKGFLHNLGQTMMLVAEMTRPGQAIVQGAYRPGIQRYEEETGARAKQIEALRGQQEEAEKLGTAGAGMVSKPITAAGTVMRGEAMLQRAQAYVPLAQAQARAAIAGIDLKRAAIDEKVRNDVVRELQAKIDEQGRNYRQLHKDATDEEVAAVVAGSREAIANEVSARNPSLWNEIKNAFGVETPQLPGAPQPQLTPTPQKPGVTAKPGATPQRPPGVPAGAVWNPKVRRWQLPNK